MGWMVLEYGGDLGPDAYDFTDGGVCGGHNARGQGHDLTKVNLTLTLNRKP